MRLADSVWSGRIAFVTGGSGFVGHWLIRRLAESGVRIIAFGRTEVPALAGSSTFIQGSLTEYNLLARTIRDSGTDAIFHLAAQSKVESAREDPRQTFETNILGTWNLLEAARHAGRPISIVLASTEMASGVPESLPMDPDGIEGMFPYPASKFCAEVLGKCYQRTYGMMLAIARTSNLYGGGDLSFERIIPGTVRSVLSGQAPVISSNGLAERDYLYVEDAVTGYMQLAAAMVRPEVSGQTFAFSTDAPVRVITIVEMIIKLMGRMDLKPQVLGRGGNTPSIRHSSPVKAREKLGWVAESSLESGLKKTIEWYKAHLNE